MHAMGYPRILRSASLGVVEAVVDPVLTEMPFPEDLHARISQRPVLGEGQQTVVLAVKDRGVASVLVGHSFQIWLTSGVLAAAAVLLPFVVRAAEGLPTANVGVRWEEEAAVPVDLLLSR
jgi:disulfide bond formation protein DsbB